MIDNPQDSLDSAEVVDAFRTTWSLFTAMEREDEEARLAILTACDDWVLLTGWQSSLSVSETSSSTTRSTSAATAGPWSG